MLFRLLLLGLLFGAILRFFWRMFSFFLPQRPNLGKSQTKKRQKSMDLDPSQIQDADFKDL